MRVRQSWPEDASPDEVAAVMAALATYFARSDDETAEPGVTESRWARAGRLEALGHLPSRTNLERGWRL